MNLKTFVQLFSFRDLRNAILGLAVVFGGLGLAGLTFWAQYVRDARLAGFAAAASLGFVLLTLIFVVPPLVRSASAEASQMNLPFDFTIGGAIILGLIILVGFSAWSSGNNLLFLMLSFLTASLFVSFLVGNFCLKKLDVKMRFSETIFAGEPTLILVSLHNRKRIFPTFSVVAEVRGSERERSVLFDEVKKKLPAKWAEKLTRPPVINHPLDYFVHVPHRDFVENKAEHIFKTRGRFIIKHFELSTRFPFGFFRHRRRLSAQETEIIIFPPLAPIDSEIVDLPLEAGKLVRQKKGLGQDLLSLRDYQPLDDLRRVDWKATARAQRLIVREFSAEDDKRITVILDTRLPRKNKEKQLTLRQKIEAEQKGEKLSPESEQFEKGVRLSASLLAHFTEEQAEIRFVVNNEKGDFGIGKQHLFESLKRLALIEPSFDVAADFSNEMLEEIFTETENSYTFFVTLVKEQNLPTELMHKAKIIEF